MTYKCVCDKQFTGTNCETKSDKIEKQNYCKEGVCLNNGTCLQSPLLEGFRCQCPKNFEGVFCEKPICPEAACGPASECVLRDDNSGYYCKNFNPNPCSKSPCGRFGICEVVNQSPNRIKLKEEEKRFKCICLNGHTGEFCDAEIQVCSTNLCAHGKCKENSNFDFECECYSGYAGKRCDIRKSKQLKQRD